MAHKHAAVIHAWADGKTIQFKYDKGHWIDADVSELFFSFTDNHEWRIKPETLRYRVALMKGDTGNYWAKLVHSKDEVKMDIASNTYYANYVKWLTDWIEVEV